MTVLSYPELLTRAQAETERIKAALESLNAQYFEMSELGQRITIRNLTAYNLQRRDIFIQIMNFEAELRRSRGREAIIKRNIDAGIDRKAQVEQGTDPMPALAYSF